MRCLQTFIFVFVVSLNNVIVSLPNNKLNLNFDIFHKISRLTLLILEDADGWSQERFSSRRNKLSDGSIALDLYVTLNCTLDACANLLRSTLTNVNQVTVGYQTRSSLNFVK